MTQFDPVFLAIANLGVLIFIIASMLGMGFNLTIPQILAPLKNRKLVIMALVANFVVVPVLALLIVWIIPLSEGLQIGLIAGGYTLDLQGAHQRLQQVALARAVRALDQHGALGVVAQEGPQQPDLALASHGPVGHVPQRHDAHPERLDRGRVPHGARFVRRAEAGFGAGARPAARLAWRGGLGSRGDRRRPGAPRSGRSGSPPGRGTR